MKLLKQFSQCAILFASLSMSVTANAENALDLDALLKTLENGQAAQTAENSAREAEFRRKEDQQLAMLSQLTAKRDRELARSERLETSFEENEIKLQNLTDTLSKRM